jgi:uncharacterized protein (DUF2141 family)
MEEMRTTNTTSKSTLRSVIFGLALTTIVSACASSSPPPRSATFVPRYATPEFASETGRIEVRVSGIPSVQGQLFVELYDRATYFHYDRVLAEKVVPVTAREMVVSLDHVPPGRYIVAVSHDANANRAMDTGLFGIPKEAYGFSRDARGTFGPPGFESGAFDFTGGTLGTSVTIR